MWGLAAMADAIAMTFNIDADLKAELDAFCARNGFSLTGFTNVAIRERLERLRHIEDGTAAPQKRQGR